MKDKVKKINKPKKPKKKIQVLKGTAQALIYGTPIATLVGMGIRVYVNETPSLTFLDNFTFKFSFWAIVVGLIIVPIYMKLLRVKLRDKMLLQEGKDGYVAPRFRLLQTAQYGISMLLLIAIVFILRILTSNDMLTFLYISGGSGIVGYTMLTIDSINKQSNKELEEIEKIQIK